MYRLAGLRVTMNLVADHSDARRRWYIAVPKLRLLAMAERTIYISSRLDQN